MLIKCTVGVSMCTGDYGQIKPEISWNGFQYLSIGRNCGAVSTQRGNEVGDAGDIIKVYVVDDLTNSTDTNPIIFQ